MQRDDGWENPAHEGHVAVLHPRKLAAPQHTDFAVVQHLLPYRLRMRNPAEQRKTWGTYVSNLRDALALTRQEFADKVGVDAATVWRWETAKTKPEATLVPERIADAFKLDLDEVLAAAGLRPDIEVSDEPSLEEDIEIERIRRSGLTKKRQEELIAHVYAERQRDLERRMAQTDIMIRHAGGKAS